MKWERNLGFAPVETLIKYKDIALDKTQGKWGKYMEFVCDKTRGWLWRNPCETTIKYRISCPTKNEESQEDVQRMYAIKLGRSYEKTHMSEPEKTRKKTGGNTSLSGEESRDIRSRNLRVWVEKNKGETLTYIQIKIRKKTGRDVGKTWEKRGGNPWEWARGYSGKAWAYSDGGTWWFLQHIKQRKRDLKAGWSAGKIMWQVGKKQRGFRSASYSENDDKVIYDFPRWYDR